MTIAPLRRSTPCQFTYPEIEKKKAFMNFLNDKKKPATTKYTTSKDNRFKVVNQAKGVAKKPGQRKRPRNETANKR